VSNRSLHGCFDASHQLQLPRAQPSHGGRNDSYVTRRVQSHFLLRKSWLIARVLHPLIVSSQCVICFLRRFWGRREWKPVGRGLEIGLQLRIYRRCPTYHTSPITIHQFSSSRHPRHLQYPHNPLSKSETHFWDSSHAFEVFRQLWIAGIMAA
jgi:hypothetical protein